MMIMMHHKTTTLLYLWICVLLPVDGGVLQNGANLVASCASKLTGKREKDRRRDLQHMIDTEEEACTPEELFGSQADDHLSTKSNDQVYETSYKQSITSPQIHAHQVDKYGSDFGEAQILEADTPELQSKIADWIKETRTYMVDTVSKEEQYKDIKDICRNQNPHCTLWAISGECEANPAYMTVHCAPACQSCELLDVNVRCPMDPNAVDALANPGDLNAMFERITTDPYYQQFEPVVLSRPSYVNGDTAANATYKVRNPYKIRKDILYSTIYRLVSLCYVSTFSYSQIGIWMVMFEKALSEEEADRMIELGGFLGYKRSADVGDRQADGTYTDYVNEGRTSTNAVCTIQGDFMSCHIPTIRVSNSCTSLFLVPCSISVVYG